MKLSNFLEGTFIENTQLYEQQSTKIKLNRT